MEEFRGYDSQLCYFKWIGMLLYLSFNNTFKDVYNVLGLLVIILYFNNVMKTSSTRYESKLHTNAHRATDKLTNPAGSGMLFTVDFICTLYQPHSVSALCH